MSGVRHAVNTVRLPRALVDELLQRARQSPQEEICGLIGRDRDGGYRCYPVPNRAADRSHAFALDPKRQIDAMRRMRERGEELAAIYHSHPDAPPLPSPVDIDQHQYPDVLYLIVSLAGREEPELRGFYLRPNQVETVAIDSSR